MGITLPKEFESADLIIQAAETEDEIGTVLRIHLALEKILAWYINLKITEETKPYINTPREFKGMLSFATALGLPLPLVRVFHQINVIRNEIAHRNKKLGADQIQQLAREVNRLKDFDSTFSPLEDRYIELPAKRPNERITFNSGDTRLDFLLASMAFYEVAMKLAAAYDMIQNQRT